MNENRVEREGLIVGIADRMTENWILGCAKFRESYTVDGETEGCGGQGKLVTLLKKHGKNYHKTTVGVDLFCSIDIASTVKNSRSFADLSRAVAPYCRWIRSALERE